MPHFNGKTSEIQFTIEGSMKGREELIDLTPFKLVFPKLISECVVLTSDDK